MTDDLTYFILTDWPSRPLTKPLFVEELLNGTEYGYLQIPFDQFQKLLSEKQKLDRKTSGIESQNISADMENCSGYCFINKVIPDA